MRLGVLASELFEPVRGRVGGFGWAAREVAALYEGRPALGVEVVLIGSEPAANCADAEHRHGTRLHQPRTSRVEFVRRIRRERLDVILTIDYRPSFAPILLGLPRTPVVVWARDPRAPSDHARIATLRVPGGTDADGVAPIDCTSLGLVARLSRRLRRPLLWASPAPRALAGHASAAYGFDVGELAALPNPIPPAAPVRKADRPTVVFLGRLDPIKRPWLFVELARQLPDAEFLLLGGRYVRGGFAWEPNGLPTNVRLLGHVDGAAKASALSSAWLAVNTSIHEALPVSVLEALAYAVPVVACVDPEQVVSRFGSYVGRFDGDGLEAVPPLTRALARLLDDRAERERLGSAGRRWVRAAHSPDRFVTAFASLCTAAGVGSEPEAAAR